MSAATHFLIPAWTSSLCSLHKVILSSFTGSYLPLPCHHLLRWLPMLHDVLSCEGVLTVFIPYEVGHRSGSLASYRAHLSSFCFLHDTRHCWHMGVVPVTSFRLLSSDPFELVGFIPSLTLYLVLGCGVSSKYPYRCELPLSILFWLKLELTFCFFLPSSYLIIIACFFPYTLIFILQMSFRSSSATLWQLKFSIFALIALFF